MTDLTGKVALVTGGSKGIGRAIALAYGKQGVAVALTYVSDEDGRKTLCRRLKVTVGELWQFARTFAMKPA